MTLQIKLIILLVSLLALLGVGAGIYTKGYANGKKAENTKVMGAWRAQAEANDKETAAIRAEGYTLANDYLKRLNVLEARYARTNSKLYSELAKPANCPASGAIGDVVLSADFIDSMFNREPATANPSSPGTSGPDTNSAVRRP